MAERHSKTTFTGEELRRIIALVRELEAANSSKQKNIRAKIRTIGLYWSEVAPGLAYTVGNLQRLFEDGTLRLSDAQESAVRLSASEQVSKHKSAQASPQISVPASDEIAQYKEAGFEGFYTVSQLRGTTSLLPEEAGVYVVIRDSTTAPQFLEKGTGGFHKGKDPNVPISELVIKYVADSKTVYIGKATSLLSRICQLLRFGAGAASGHWGGRYLWQLADADDLIVAWKTTPGIDPRTVEAQMILDFISLHGKRPFANLKD